MIFGIRPEELIDNLIKQAEAIYGRNPIVNNLLDKAFERVGKFADDFYGLQDQSLAMLRMLRSWYAREYTGLSKQSVVSLLASAIYIVSPLDIIPDFLPFIGRFDDRLILAYFIKKLNVEIQRYMAWEQEQGFA